MKLPIDTVRVTPRFRKTLGDVPALATSIQRVGLLHRARGVSLTPDGDVLRCRPKSALADEDLKALTALKADVLSLLRQEQLLRMSLSEFEAQDAAIEVQVQGLPFTIWFVPRLELVDVLVREGIARGRIWTAGELRDLASIPGLNRDEVAGIARLKAGLGGVIVAVHLDPEGSHA